MNTLKIFNSTITSDIDCVRSTVSNILSSCKDRCAEIDEESLFDLKVILNELILNAIKHGNQQECSKCVKVTVGLARNQYVLLIIEDEGTGYNYTCTCDNSNNLDEMTDIFSLKETGRGLLIVKNLCDKVKFNNKGNKIVVLKKISKNESI